MLILGDILRRHARARGGKTAYIIGDERVTYDAFHARSNQLARALQGLGVRRGDRVAVLSGNRAEYPLVYFAAIKLGAIVVPISARFTAAEVAYVLNHAEAETLFLAPEHSDLVDELRSRGECPSLHRVIGFGETAMKRDGSFDSICDGQSTPDVETRIDENDPHVMLYTSGTTGSPKGALLSQRSYFLQAGASHLLIGLNQDDVGLSMFPMFHMGGWALPLGFWHTGATVVLLPKAEPRAILEAVQRERVTYLYAVPTVFRSMLALPDFDRFDLGSLRLIGGGTAAMTAEQVREIKDRFRCRDMVVIYGSTEAGPVSLLRPRDVERRPETVGRPYLDVDVRLVGDDGDALPGAAGEIAVRSEFTMRGYWRNPEETARTLRDGWVFTGDLGVFDEEGFLSIVGRRKEVIRSGGESIFPVEIERVLLDHPAIREASVVGIPDAHWGEAVVAAVVLRDGAVATADDLVEHVRSKLAGYKKPRHVCFLDQLPRTAASQQVHKSLLREIVLRQIGE